MTFVSETDLLPYFSRIAWSFGRLMPTGVIGPENQIQPSGRQLKPTGKLTKIGNHPGGGAITTNGRFLWTLSAGRGRNDILRALLEVRYPHLVSFEFEKDADDPVPGLAETIGYAKGILAGLA